MNSRRKQRLLRMWLKLVHFVKWCENHGITKVVVETILKVLIWWLTRR